jgi:predicted HTH transcriptional regulator
MIPDLIRKQVRQGEGVSTAFMSDARRPEAIAKTVCAFLNTRGGTVFCGVNAQGEVVGIEGAPDTIHSLHAYLLESITPKALFTVNVDDENGTSVLSIEVPEGKDRPYVVAGSFNLERCAEPISLSIHSRLYGRGWSMLLRIGIIRAFQVASLLAFIPTGSRSGIPDIFRKG